MVTCLPLRIIQNQIKKLIVLAGIYLILILVENVFYVMHLNQWFSNSKRTKIPESRTNHSQARQVVFKNDN